MTGSAAVTAVLRREPALIILDLGLPDVDGIDLCRRLREWTNIPIIVLTAEGAEARKVEALDEGANDYVTKPFSTPELLARVRSRSDIVAKRRTTHRRRFSASAISRSTSPATACGSEAPTWS